MVLEHALLSVRPGQEPAFERAFTRARPLIAAAAGFRGLTLGRSVERPGTYLLLVEWRSVEDHTAGFRGSPAHREWRELLHRFSDPSPTVEHYAPVAPVGPDDAPAPTLGPLHHVQLAVPAGSEDACRRFWGGVLGLRELAKPPALAARGGCWFGGGALEVHCGVEEPFAPAAKAHPGVLAVGLADLAERLERAGHPVTWDDAFPGHDRFYASDPFGNRLELLEPRAPA